MNAELFNLVCPVCGSDQINADVLRHDWMHYECVNCDSEGEGPINTLAERIDISPWLAQRQQWARERNIRANRRK